MKKIIVGLMFLMFLTAATINSVFHAEKINHATSILPPDKAPTFPVGKITYQQVYPVLARNCASCHNATTEGMNWLNESDVVAKRGKLYNRVFVQGDMPLFFRFFGGEEKQLLKQYLEQNILILGQ